MGTLPRNQVTVPLAYLINAYTTYIRRDVREDEATLATMVKSIRQRGLVLPLLIAPDNQVVDGAIRLEALRQLGWVNIPAIYAHNWGVTKAYFMEVQRLAGEGLAPKPMWWLDAAELIETFLKPIHAPLSLAAKGERGGYAKRNHGLIYEDLPDMFGSTGSKMMCLRDLRSAVAAANKAKGPDFAKQIVAMFERTQSDGGSGYTALETARSAIRANQDAVPDIDPRRAKAMAREQVEAIDRLVVVLQTLGVQASKLLPVAQGVDAETAWRLGNAIRTATKRISPLGTALRDHAQFSQGESE